MRAKVNNSSFLSFLFNKENRQKFYPLFLGQISPINIIFRYLFTTIMDLFIKKRNILKDGEIEGKTKGGKLNLIFYRKFFSTLFIYKTSLFVSHFFNVTLSFLLYYDFRIMQITSIIYR